MRVVLVKESDADGAGLRRIDLHHLTDFHVGAPDFDEAELKRRVEMIAKDPYARWTMGGDAGDLIWHRDRRYSPTELHPRYRLATSIRDVSKEHLVEMLSPIADKCWAWADGNHERVVDEHYGGKFGVEVCCALGIEDKWVGYRGFVHVQFNVTKTQRVGQLIDIQHGWQVGRGKGGPPSMAEREFSTTDADVLLRGHSHQPSSHTFVTLGVNSKQRIVRRFRTAINGGCWRVGYRDDLAPVDPAELSAVEGDLWHETKGFRAESIGGPVLRFSLGMGVGHNRKHVPPSVEHTVFDGFIDDRVLGLDRY
jgi:hypothetical protein